MALWTRDRAWVRSRLVIAAIRGLLLDLLLTGDRRLLDEAAHLLGQLLTQPAPRREPG